MESEPKPDTEEEEIIEKNGKKYRRVDTGYTLKQYFSHHTDEKGPGPGWDTRRGYLEELGYGIEYFRNPSLLPDEPFYHLEELK